MVDIDVQCGDVWLFGCFLSLAVRFVCTIKQGIVR